MSQTKSPSFVEQFAQIKEPRVKGRCEHKLIDILFIALCAAVGGADDFNAIAIWARSRRSWLEQYVELPNGIPTHDTFNRVFQAIDPRE